MPEAGQRHLRARMSANGFERLDKPSEESERGAGPRHLGLYLDE